jgi:hypothetical protein
MPSGTIWGDCPEQEIKNGEVPGFMIFDDFVQWMKTPATTEGNWAAGGGYSQFSDTGGTIANDSTTGTGGEVAIGSDGDNEGCSFRTTATPFRISRSFREVWFEARIKSSTIADAKHNIFIGFLEDVALTATVPITATGTLADNNLVGFQRPETVRSVAGTGGAIMNTVYKANGVTAVTLQTDAVALVANTYTKVGLKFRRGTDRMNPQTNILSFYQDGVRLATAYAMPSAQGTDFPNDVSLGLVFAVLNATAATPGTSTIDWWKAAQVTF